jgi:hypothetical protein
MVDICCSKTALLTYFGLLSPFFFNLWAFAANYSARDIPAWISPPPPPPDEPPPPIEGAGFGFGATYVDVSTLIGQPQGSSAAAYSAAAALKSVLPLGPLAGGGGGLHPLPFGFPIAPEWAAGALDFGFEDGGGPRPPGGGPRALDGGGLRTGFLISGWTARG